MRRPTRILTLAALVPLTAVALAACTPSTTLPAIPTPTATPTPTAKPGPSVAQIAVLARRDVGEGTVVSVEDESAGTEWDVLVVAADGTEQEVHLSDEGVVLAGPSENTTDANAESANRARVAAATVTLAAAYRKAVSAVPGGRVTALALDEYQDRVVWRADVLADGVRHDVRVDAVSGGVLLNRPDASPSAVPRRLLIRSRIRMDRSTRRAHRLSQRRVGRVLRIRGGSADPRGTGSEGTRR